MSDTEATNWPAAADADYLDTNAEIPGWIGGAGSEVEKHFKPSRFFSRDASGNLIHTKTTTYGQPAATQIAFGASNDTCVDGSKVYQYSIIVTGAGNGQDLVISGLRRSAADIERFRLDRDGHIFPGVTNVQDIGKFSAAFRDIYLLNSPTITSDADRKKRGAGLSEAEVRAGRRIARELCWWQWLESVAQKGDAARLHFGPMAQDMARIFVEEGVEVDYGDGNPSFRSDMLGWDEWGEESEPIFEIREVEEPCLDFEQVGQDRDGNPLFATVDATRIVKQQFDTGKTRVKRSAGSGWRIDPSQVAFFLIAVQAAVQDALEARLAALESVA